MTDERRKKDEAEEQAHEELEIPEGETPERPTEGEQETREGRFDVDDALAEAMKAAEDSYARLEREALTGDEEGIELEIEEGGVPVAGAGEGVVRALAEMRKARDELEIAQGKVKDLEGRLLRTAADLENYKKRVAREREEERKYAIERLLKDLLPVIDNMERALLAATEAGEEQIVTGLRMVHKLFLDTLAKHGVEQLTALGQRFDPNFHEAMQQVETTDHPPGTVVTEYMKGYTLNGRLVRPAMVVVATAPEGAASIEGGTNGSDGGGAGAKAGAPAGDEEGGSET